MQTVLTSLAVFVIGYVVFVAAVLFLSMRLAAGFFPRFAHALLTSCVVAILSLIVCWIVAATLTMGATGAIVWLAANFFLNAMMVNVLMRRRDGATIGFGRACVVTAIQFAIEIVILFAVFLSVGAEILQFIGKLH